MKLINITPKNANNLGVDSKILPPMKCQNFAVNCDIFAIDPDFTPILALLLKDIEKVMKKLRIHSCAIDTISTFPGYRNNWLCEVQLNEFFWEFRSRVRNL